MALQVRLNDNSIFDLSTLANQARPQDRRRDYDLQIGRGVESPGSTLAGDGLENPTPFTWRMSLRPWVSRVQQRSDIAAVKAVLALTVGVINSAEGTEEAVGSAKVTQESPTGRSYVLELTFYPALSGAYTPPTVPDTGNLDTGHY